MRRLGGIFVFLFSIVLLSSNIYADSPSDWAVEDIDKLRVSSTIGEDFYDRYEENISRGDFAYLIYHLYEDISGKEFNTIGYENNRVQFSDTDDYYVTEVAKAGIVEGYGNGIYGMYDGINREQVATIYIRLLKRTGIDISIYRGYLEFSDSYNISDWAIENVGISYNMGILKGVGQNRIDPKGKTTREQSMVLYSRMLEDYSIGLNRKNEIRYRALLIGNENYYRVEDRLRGAHNDVYKMEETLKGYNFGENTGFYHIEKAYDLTGEELLQKITDYFASSDENDVNYLYYTGHGGKNAEERSSIVGVDRRFISVDRLEEVLNQVQGQKVVILDACNSGGFIGDTKDISHRDLVEYNQEYNKGVIESFSKRLGYLNGSQYKVIASAHSDQSAYEIRYPSGWGGELTREYTLGTGYRDQYLADLNLDGDITIREVYSYLQGRMVYSDVQVYPDNSEFIIASR